MILCNSTSVVINLEIKEEIINRIKEIKIIEVNKKEKQKKQQTYVEITNKEKYNMQQPNTKEGFSYFKYWYNTARIKKK